MASPAGAVDAQQQVGLLVDRVGNKQDAVIKSLGSFLPQAPLIAGVILIGNECTLVLSPMELAEQAASTSRAAHASVPPEGGQMSTTSHILVVDDDTLFRRTMAAQLEKAGYKTSQAEDGADALAMVKEHSYDLVLTDLVMPNLDGYGLTRALRKLGGYKYTPIVMISTKSEGVDKLRGFEAGIDRYLTKDTPTKEVIDAIKESFR